MRRSWLAAILVLGLALTSCSSGKKSGTTQPPSSPSTPTSPAASTSPSFNSTAAEAQIKQNWAAFFSKDTPVANKLTYLQRGSTMRAAVQQFGTDPRTRQASAKVTGVFVTSPEVATVNYQVLLAGRVALPSAVGTAVYEDGAWKVSDTTFCGLLALTGGPKPAGC